MIKRADSNIARVRRHMSIRNKIFGTAQLPRLNVYRSLNNIYAQIIDDEKGVTLVSASSLSQELKDLKNGGNIEAAKEVGKLIAKKALEKNIESVVFDRGGYLYHGRVAALADGAREGGLKF